MKGAPKSENLVIPMFLDQCEKKSTHHECRRASENTKSPRNLSISRTIWSCWADSNCRPHPYQDPGGLPKLCSFVTGNPKKSSHIKGLRVFASQAVPPHTSAYRANKGAFVCKMFARERWDAVSCGSLWGRVPCLTVIVKPEAGLKQFARHERM